MGQIISAVLSCIPSLAGLLREKRQSLRLPGDEDVEPGLGARAGASIPSMAQVTGPKPVYIAVMGLTGSGKSTFVNLASRSSLSVGRGLESCTSEVQTSNTFSIDGKQVILIDTPGFGDTTLTDSDIWKIIAASFVTSHRAGIHFSGVIYMHNISDVKMSGSARQSFKMFQELCGEEAFSNVLLVTSMWDKVTLEEGNARYQELETNDIFFKPVLEKGACMLRHDNTPTSALAIVRQVVDRPPVVLRIQKELGGGMNIMQTSVYRQIRELMSELVAQRQRKLDSLLVDAEGDWDAETQEELQEEIETARAELQEAQGKTATLASEYQSELRRIEEVLRRRRRGDISGT